MTTITLLYHVDLRDLFKAEIPAASFVIVLIAINQVFQADLAGLLVSHPVAMRVSFHRTPFNRL